MEKEKLESLIIDYIDNKLNSVDRQTVERELMRNPDAYKLYEQLKEVMHLMDRSSRFEPSKKIAAGFEEMLKQETAAAHDRKVVFFQPVYLKVAAAVAFLAVAVALGFWVNENRKQQEQIAQLQKEMEQTKQTMLKMIDNQLSASQRIQGVNVALTMKKADAEIVQVLYKTMIEDPNSNVRLSALEALDKFSYDPSVRKLLITSLSVQTDPVIQIALIQVLVKLNEKSVVNELRKIVDDEGTMKAVKDEAYTGILKLS